MKGKTANKLSVLHSVCRAALRAEPRKIGFLQTLPEDEEALCCIEKSLGLGSERDRKLADGALGLAVKLNLVAYGRAVFVFKA